jgi:hypothetical protein
MAMLILLLFALTVLGQQQQTVAVTVPLTNATTLSAAGNGSVDGACTIENNASGNAQVVQYLPEGRKVVARNGDNSLLGRSLVSVRDLSIPGDKNSIGCVGEMVVFFAYDSIGKPGMFRVGSSAPQLILDALQPVGQSLPFISTGPIKMLTTSNRWFYALWMIDGTRVMRGSYPFTYEINPTVAPMFAQSLLKWSDVTDLGWKNLTLGCLSSTSYWTGGTTNNDEIVIHRDKNGQKTTFLKAKGGTFIWSSKNPNASDGVACNADGAAYAYQLAGSSDIVVSIFNERISDISEAVTVNLGKALPNGTAFQGFDHRLLPNGKIVFISAGHLAELDPKTKAVTILVTPTQAKGQVEQVRTTAGGIVLYGVRAEGMIPKMEWNVLLRPVVGTPSVSAERQVTLPCEQCGFSDVVRPKVTVIGRTVASNYQNSQITFTLPEDLLGSLFGEVEIGNQRFPFSLTVTQQQAAREVEALVKAILSWLEMILRAIASGQLPVITFTPEQAQQTP